MGDGTGIADWVATDLGRSLGGGGGAESEEDEDGSDEENFEDAMEHLSIADEKPQAVAVAA